MHMRDRTYQRAVLRDGKSMQYMLGKSSKQTASSAARNLKYIILRSSKETVQQRLHRQENMQTSTASDQIGIVRKFSIYKPS